MIVERFWTTVKRKPFGGRKEKVWQGWFLLGLIPLFVRQVGGSAA